MIGTIVTIDAPTAAPADVDRAFQWFHEVEQTCSRFDDASELSQLVRRAGEPVPVSALLYEAVAFSLHMAHASGGAFDPTGNGRFDDIRCDAERRSITLASPLALDLGGVAKGLAVDLASRELADSRNFLIDAGGDLYAGGRNAQGQPWRAGIRHPRQERTIIEVMHVSDGAVCTSGDYERGAHIVDPRTGRPADRLVSVTVAAPTAIAADAIATAAFVLGPDAGLAFCRRSRVTAVMYAGDLTRLATSGDATS